MLRIALSCLLATACGCRPGSAALDAGSDGGTGTGCVPGSVSVLPEDVAFIDPATGAETDRCTRIVRVSSFVGAPAVRDRIGAIATYTYVALGDDGEVVMIDAGLTHHVTALTGSTPTVEENVALRDRLETAVGLLAPGRGLRDVEALYIDHGHPDHTMQGAWVRAARGTPLTVWIGEDDRAFVTDPASLSSCLGAPVPDALLALLPRYEAPTYDVRTVPTGRPPSIQRAGSTAGTASG
jgi:hypothetical protein